MNIASISSSILLISFSVILSWITIWNTINNSKVGFSLPFLLVGIASFFYAGLIIYSSPSEIYDILLESLYLLSNFILFALVLRRYLWYK
jgi:hypothetical protein